MHSKGPGGRFIEEAVNDGRDELIDEVYFFTFSGDRIAEVWALEDTIERFPQLDLDPRGL